jgi:ubiquinone/menaquinone biosynthesis C-methylase UbiE
MNPREHWERVYTTKRVDEVSWFRPHLDTSLEMIGNTGAARNARIVDVGAGASTLVDDLLDAGYSELTVLDVSAAALERAKERLGSRASDIAWIAADVTRANLPAASFDVWHDRAVFHFLTDPDDRRRYVNQVRHAVACGGHVIVATFGPDGPQRCSGLPTARYTPGGLHAEFGSDFALVDRREERHTTPAGVEQQFVYCL